MNRRNFLKTASMASAAAFVPSILVLEGCGADQIIAGLQTADQVILAAKNILAPVNPTLAVDMAAVSTALEVVVKTYQDYEVATAANKPGLLGALQGAISGITTNLSNILNAVHVKNPELVTYVSVAIAVVNSALIILSSKIAGTTTKGLAVRDLAIQSNLPVVPNAKSAKDLKNAWNNAVKDAYPKSKI